MRLTFDCDRAGALSGISVQNLAYFNGKWHHKFTKSQEKMMDFIPFGTTNEDEDDVLKTPCLYTHGRFRSANLGRLDARVLQLPFEVPSFLINLHIVLFPI